MFSRFFIMVFFFFLRLLDFSEGLGFSKFLVFGGCLKTFLVFS